jgi:hypothetical protein
VKRVALGVLLLATACDSWDPAVRARQRASETFSCADVTMTQTGEDRWHANGCGMEGDFACTSGRLEPTCIQVRTAGGERPDDEDDVGAPPSVAESEAALYAQAEADDPDLDPTADEGEAEATHESAPPAESAVQRAIRAGIDAHRADVFACTQHDPTVVRVRYETDGAITLSLAGGLEGTPEEGCVRAALAGARAPEGESGVLLHLVHGS